MSPREELFAQAECLLEARDLDAARDTFLRIAAKGGEGDRCDGGLWTTYMLLGEMELAWQRGDAIRRRCAADPHRFWNGEEVDGKRLMIRCLHGFGDAVQMFRYMVELQRRCAQVIVEVPPRLIELVPLFAGVGVSMAWGDVEPAWDMQVEITELPYIFRTTLRDLPVAESYLKLPADRVSAVGAMMGTSRRPRVGVVWSTGEWNLARAVPFHFIEELVRDAQFEFWNLQGDSAHGDWRVLGERDHLRDAAGLGGGILTLAACIANVDLVITVDTLAAHLAGAMGKSAWVLLQHAADWRWMHARFDSPWYPSLRLFRQSTQGAWDEVVAGITRDLSSLQIGAVA